MIYFLNTVLTIILALFFILFGILAFLLAFSPSIQMLSVNFIQNHFWTWIFFGLGLLIIGGALISYTFLTRKTYLTTQTNAHSITISESVINEYLKSYFEKLFPKQHIPYRFLIKKRKMQIIADLPYIPLEEQKILLQSIENDLQEILSQYLGYHKALEISVSFEKQK